MKDYKRHVLWLDYFNSSLSREQGRRIPLDRSVKDPKLGELLEATQRLGYEPEPETVKHPKRMWVPSGCVSVEKKAQVKKSWVISEVAKVLSNVRGEKASMSAQPSKGQQKQGSKPHKH
ncbi:MAG: signal recognition particle subunit SRP19/SEC65 family protein [Nitrososphaerales archaeon]